VIGEQPLPYPIDALEPWVSSGTLALHYGLYQKYVMRVRGYFARAKAPPEPASLEEALDYAVDKSKDMVLLHNVQQALNHELLWDSMAPSGMGGAPDGLLADMITARWRTYSDFYEDFLGKSIGLFGSGWVWLAFDGRRLEVLASVNADQPWQMGGFAPLLCLDVWEHAYVCDYGGDRSDYVETFLRGHVNWHSAMARLESLTR
jgi:Fe-Mn family superoxide dismutase